jgi:hypothetical protein
MKLAAWLLERLYIYGKNKAFKSNRLHAVETKMPPKIIAHAMETPTLPQLRYFYKLSMEMSS